MLKAPALAMSLLLALAAPAAARSLGTLTGAWDSTGTRSVRVGFPVGELHIVESDGPEIRAALTVRCPEGSRACEERSRRIKLITDREGATRWLRVEGHSRLRDHGLKMELRLEVPRGMAVNVEMGVGDCQISGVSGDLKVELGIGDVEVSMREAIVHSVRASVGIGDATLRHGGHSYDGSGFLGRKLHWLEGRGEGRVSVELGIGDVDVRLN